MIVSKIDHESNIAPWVHLADLQNLTIKWWVPKTKENPTLEAEDLKELLTDKTVLVTCTHASNILGTIHDIKAIADAVHTIPGALICVDGVAYAPHRRIDVKALGVDFYSFSWYKVLKYSHFSCKQLMEIGLWSSYCHTIFLNSRPRKNTFPRSLFQT